MKAGHNISCFIYISHSETRLIMETHSKGQFVLIAPDMYCPSNSSAAQDTVQQGWHSLQHHTAVTRGTSRFNINQCHGYQAAAHWCKWVVTKQTRVRRVEESSDTWPRWSTDDLPSLYTRIMHIKSIQGILKKNKQKNSLNQPLWIGIFARIK